MDEIEIKYKKIVSMGVNTIINDETISAITAKVLCNTQYLVEVNRCMRCPYNKEILNQFIMKCNRKYDEEPPESLNKDPDYDNPEGK